MAAATPDLSDIVLHQATRTLEVRFADGSVFRLPAEFLRRGQRLVPFDRDRADGGQVG